MKYIFLFTFIIICSALNAQNLSNGLQAHYKFDGDLLDYSGNAYHLQNGLGSITYNLISGTDQSVYFDGADRVDQIGSFDNSTWVSSAISLWVKSSTVNTLDQFIIQGAYMGFGIFIGGTNGYVGGYFQYASSTAYYNMANIADGNWHHIVYQTNGTMIFLYIDGVNIGSQPHTLITGTGATNNKLYFGQAIISPRPFTGSLNECRIYDRMLSECEIQTLAGLGNTAFATVIEENVCENYYWVNTNTTYITSGEYSDTVQTSGGCDSIITLDLTIETIDTTVTELNGVLTSNESGAISYEWMDCNEGNIIGTGQSFSPSYNGNFAVIISTDNCIDTSGCYPVKGLSIDDISASGIQIYQANNKVYVEAKQYELISTIVLRDILGRVVVQHEVIDSKLEFILSVKGIYIVEIHVGSKIYEQKIIY